VDNVTQVGHKRSTMGRYEKSQLLSIQSCLAVQCSTTRDVTPRLST